MATMIRRTLALGSAITVWMALVVPVAFAKPPFEQEALDVRRCVVHADLMKGRAEKVPTELAVVIRDGLADDRLHRIGMGATMWIEGYGEVIAVNADLRLRPASNQKLLTAAGALQLLGPDARLTTVVIAAGRSVDGVLDGDVYLVGGGDPTLTLTGPHSLEVLAERVAAAGITHIRGDVYVDETRYDMRRRANGWDGIMSPTWMGSLSALMVDENRYRIDADFLNDPTTTNVSLFREALVAAGISVEGGTGAGQAPVTATALTNLTSPPIRELVAAMLVDSNNTIAEMLVKEVGYVVRGIGSTAAGLDAMATLLDDFCLPETILQLDGSGLSHGNARSARDWRRLFMSAQSTDWYDDFVDGLAVAGETGTLKYRFRGTAAAGNLRAKTGTITGIRSLTGTMTTAGGRRVFFSFIVDDDEPRPPMSAIDALVADIAADES